MLDTPSGSGLGMAELKQGTLCATWVWSLTGMALVAPPGGCVSQDCEACCGAQRLVGGGLEHSLLTLPDILPGSAAPCGDVWICKLVEQPKQPAERVLQIQRSVLIPMIRAYKACSTDALLVVADLPPLDLVLDARVAYTCLIIPRRASCPVVPSLQEIIRLSGLLATESSATASARKAI
ncbi:hypothetical protein GE061_014545 [Apolygus lucorum]|uniref:Uncharacterized protein n=1 Tax=Apolygus lucorum TaxID=248454 RepID=A0A8S9XJS2_APOLU|nr:hypothetical protein GE061_014545 [Apolygus lucorum]